MNWTGLKRALLQGAVDVFDRDLRHLAKKIADFIRPKLNFGKDLNEELIERLLGAFRGFLGGLVEQNVSGVVWKVAVEKGIDLADFISSYTFNGTHGIDEWSERRLARIRQSIADGKISREDALVLEELLNRLYSDVQWGIDKTQGDVVREKIDRQWDRRMQGLRGKVSKPAADVDRTLAQEVHPEARRFASAFASAYKGVWSIVDGIGASLDRATHMEFTDEQEAILQAKEDELDRLRTQTNFEAEMAVVEKEIARVHRRRKRR